MRLSGPEFRRDPDSGLWQVARRVEIARSIRAGMPENPNTRLDHFRWRNDDGDESSTGATFAESEDTNHTVVGGADTDFDRRIRIVVDQTNDIHDQGGALTARVERKLNTGGAWGAVPASGGAEVVLIDTGSGLTDGDPTTDHAMTLSFTFLAGEQEESGSDADAVTWPNGTPSGAQRSGIWEWGLTFQAANLANNDVVFFRVSNAGTLLDTYDFGDASDTNPITVTVTAAPVEVAFPPFARRKLTTVRM